MNLRGHGPLVARSSINGFRNIPYIARSIPEFMTGTTTPGGAYREVK